MCDDRLKSLSALELQYPADIIHVTNLQLPEGILAPDIWQQDKQQPAHVNLELGLSPGLGSAASLDQLDNKTIHYGELCKLVRSESQPAQDVRSTVSKIQKAVTTMMETCSSDVEATLKTTLRMPKLSVYGGEINVTACSWHRPTTLTNPQWFSITFDKLHIMTVIGLNAQERTGTQSLLFRCTLETRQLAKIDELLRLERTLAGFVEGTTFETLEKLAVSTIEQISKLNNHNELGIHAVGVRFDKPSAVIWADGPAVELRRQIPAL